jgi:hypothetical protein
MFALKIMHTNLLSWNELQRIPNESYQVLGINETIDHLQ